MSIVINASTVSTCILNHHYTITSNASSIV